MLLLTVYELAATLAPGLIAYAFARMRGWRIRGDAVGFAPMLLFSLYVFAVLFVTGAGTVYNLFTYGLEINPHQLNLVPLVSMAQAADVGDALAGFALNVVLFAPLGLLLPLVWPQTARALSVGAFGFVFSLAIESSQLLNNRTTDVDDLLANTLGALAGFAVYTLWRGATGRSRTVRGKQPQPALQGPALCVSILFVSHFLLFNEFGFMKLLYGF